MVTSLGPTRSVERMIVRAPQSERLPGVDQPGVLRAPQVGGVDRDQHVGGGVLALGLEPLVQLGGVAAADRQVRAGLLREVLERLLLAVVRAGGVEHELVGGRRRRSRARPHERGHEQHGAAHDRPDQPASRHQGWLRCSWSRGVLPVVSVPVVAPVLVVEVPVSPSNFTSPRAILTAGWKPGGKRRGGQYRDRLPQHAH